jgi:hypothetical protein
VNPCPSTRIMTWQILNVSQKSELESSWRSAAKNFSLSGHATRHNLIDTNFPTSWRRDDGRRRSFCSLCLCFVLSDCSRVGTGQRLTGHVQRLHRTVEEPISRPLGRMLVHATCRKLVPPRTWRVSCGQAKTLASVAMTFNGYRASLVL